MEATCEPTEVTVDSELLLLVVGEGDTSTHILPAWGEVLIGRDPSCRIVVNHPGISPTHARLHLSPERITVEDLGTPTGTLVRDRPLLPRQPTLVGCGETIEIGSTLIIVKRRSFEASPRPTVANQDVGPAPMAVIGATSAMDAIRRLVGRIAPSDISVLILGETGVGKDVVSEMIHRMSRRANKPLVRLNCAALSETLLASELFGHERGAFTGAFATKPGLLETAEGGTIFLDEVGELPMSLQSKLLHVLEEREVLRVGGLHPRAIDVRFIAATNRELESEIEAGGFRRDLYYRLNGARVKIPPLRQRVDEILPLARTFLEEPASQMQMSPPRISASAEALLQGHDWPGNIRELRNVMVRALLLCEDDTIRAEHLELPASGVKTATTLLPAAPTGASSARMEPVDPPMDQERARILEALTACAGNQTQAARRLGISRRTLINRILEYGLPRPRKTAK